MVGSMPEGREQVRGMSEQGQGKSENRAPPSESKIARVRRLGVHHRALKVHSTSGSPGSGVGLHCLSLLYLSLQAPRSFPVLLRAAEKTCCIRLYRILASFLSGSLGRRVPLSQLHPLGLVHSPWEMDLPNSHYWRCIRWKQ